MLFSTVSRYGRAFNSKDTSHFAESNFMFVESLSLIDWSFQTSGIFSTVEIVATTTLQSDTIRDNSGSLNTVIDDDYTVCCVEQK